MKTITLVLSIILATNISAQVQDNNNIKEQPFGIPESFFDWSNYVPSYQYDSIHTSGYHRWVSLYGEYDRHLTSTGAWRFGSMVELGIDNRFRIIHANGQIGGLMALTACSHIPDDYGDYQLDSINGLLYMRWDQSEDSLRCHGIVCRAAYYVSVESGPGYKEALELFRYVGAAWDMPVDKILTCKTVPEFGILVRQERSVLF